MGDTAMTIGRMGPFDLPGVAAWRDSLKLVSSGESVSGPVNYLAYIANEVGFDRAFAVLRLLMPQFEEVRGCVLMKGTGSYTSASFDQWWRRFGGDVGAVEEMINHLPLWDVFTRVDESPETEAAMVEFGMAMAKTWEAALLDSFPDRKFVVEFSNGIVNYGPTLTFRSVRTE